MKENNFTQEFQFFKKALFYNKIPIFLLLRNEPFRYDDAMGLPKELFRSNTTSFIHYTYENHLKPNSLLYITDEYYFHYVMFCLPETVPAQVIILGPYITESDTNRIQALLSRKDISPAWKSILQNTYLKTSCVPNKDSLNAILYSFSDIIWGENNYKADYYENDTIDSVMMLATSLDVQYQLEILSNTELVENFYAEENALMNAISCGQSLRAKNILNNIPLLNFKNQTEPLQNLRVFTTTLNTLFRKAAEKGGVHPLYLDQLSNFFFEKIIEFSRSDNILDLWNEMIQKYCALVNNHATRNYSLPIQKIILKIDSDLSSDLSLKALANYLNVNASYLSNLFRKETGDTLTNYVNKRRMEYASHLLQSTPHSISTIAQACGILDDNYFTKLFKKHYKLTPTKFRNNVGVPLPSCKTEISIEECE